MSVNVKSILEKGLAADKKSIKITPDMFTGPLETAIENYLSGSLSVGGTTFSFDGDSAKATVKGEVSDQPLASLTIEAVFTADGDGVSMDLTATLTSDWKLSDAWSELNSAPFNDLTLTGGLLTFTANFSKKTVDFKVDAVASYQGQSLNNGQAEGLFEVTYDSSLNFLAGFVVSGDWDPQGTWSEIGGLNVSALGLFFSTSDGADLSGFTNLQTAYLPKSLKAGLTLVADLGVDKGSVSALENLFSGATLDLLAEVPTSGGPTFSADLKADIPLGIANFQGFQLTWDTGAETISLSASAQLTDASAGLDFLVEGDGTIAYGGAPSASFTVEGKDWVNPFGIQNLTVNTFGLGVAFSDALVVDAEGSISVGSGADAVTLTLVGAIADFEVPAGIDAKLSSEDADKKVELATMIHDFLPGFPTDFPLLDDIGFSNLEFWIVDAPFTAPDGKSYGVGIGATGDINIFSLDLDFAFTLNSKVSPPSVQAYGSISDNGKPIEVTGAGITWVKLSNAAGNAGPCACIDTTGSDYCSGKCGSGAAGSGYYFFIDASVEILGLTDTVVAKASKDMFDFDAKFSFLGDVLSAELACTIDPSNMDFSGMIDFEANIPDITIGPYELIPGLTIPKFTIPTPDVDFCVALGTVVPSLPLCDGYTPPAAPYFYLHFKFDWGAINFDVSFEVDMSLVQDIFSDFGKFITDWLLNPDNWAKLFEKLLAAGAKLILQLLQKLAVAFEEAVEAVAKYVGEAVEDIAKLATEVWDDVEQCATKTANAALS